MEFVILNTVSQHRFSTESSIVWVNHSSEQLIYGKSHVNQFFFFFYGMTVNPNITKQEGIAFFAKTLCFYWLGWPRANTQYALYSNAGVKSRSFISTPCKIRFHRNFIFLSFLLRIYKHWSCQSFRDGFWPHLFWHIDIKDIFVPLERRSWTQHHQSDWLMQTGPSSSFDREVTSLASHCTQDTTKNLATLHSFVGHYSEYWLTLRQRFVTPITHLDSLAHSKNSLCGCSLLCNEQRKAIFSTYEYVYLVTIRVNLYMNLFLGRKYDAYVCACRHVEHD